MSTLTLTEPRMRDGVWQGIITGTGQKRPRIAVSHLADEVPHVELVHDRENGHWVLSVPIPPAAIADGVQTLLIRDAAADSVIGHITLMAGDVLDDDIRMELDLLRAELDMLKSAFRRHCVETA